MPLNTDKLISDVVEFSERRMPKAQSQALVDLETAFEQLQAENKKLKGFLGNLISIDNMLCLLPTPAIPKDILPRQGKEDCVILLTCDKTSSPELFLKMVTVILDET